MPRPSILFALLFVTAVPAQSSRFGGLLVGNSGPDGILSSIVGKVYTQDEVTCRPATRVGSAMRMATKGAGGAAYDAARQQVWISDGQTIGLFDLVANKLSCSFQATLTGGKGNAVTGLAHSNRRRELIQLETFPTATGSSLTLRFYDTRQCPPVLLRKSCTLPIPRGNAPGTAGGLAYDEVRDTIYFSTSLSGAVGTTSTLHHVPYVLLCLTPPSTFTLPLFAPCGGTRVNEVSGLAYDSCSRTLFVTEGRVTLLMDLTNLGNPVNLNANKPCCKFGVSREIWAGLAYIPKSHNSRIGASCLASGPCAACTSLRFDVIGDLVLGNRDLSLQVTGGPVGGAAALYVSLGTCRSPGFTLPGLCGAIHPALSAGQPLLLGSFTVSGGSGCSGTVKLPVAIPPDPVLCSTYLCAQFLVTCPQGSGAGLTNAVEFKVGG